MEPLTHNKKEAPVPNTEPTPEAPIYFRGNDDPDGTEVHVVRYAGFDYPFEKQESAESVAFGGDFPARDIPRFFFGSPSEKNAYGVAPTK